MAEFKMQHRPKKPQEPRPVLKELGYNITYLGLKEKVEEFLKEHTHLSETDLTVELDYGSYDEHSIWIMSAPGTWQDHEKKMVIYKEKLAEYNEWRKKNKIEIEKEKLRIRESIKKRKLENTLVRLKKELAETETKLCSK